MIAMAISFVKIRHAKTGLEAVVPESAVPHHVAAGWTPVEDEPTQTEEAPKFGEQEE